MIIGSELLDQGPSLTDIQSLGNWVDAYERWRSGYEAYLKAAANLNGDATDEFEDRQYEHYTALFLQSGQWHAIFLLLLKNVPEEERAGYLAELDGFLAELRGRMLK